MIYQTFAPMPGPMDRKNDATGYPDSLKSHRIDLGRNNVIQIIPQIVLDQETLADPGWQTEQAERLFEFLWAVLPHGVYLRLQERLLKHNQTLQAARMAAGMK